MEEENENDERYRKLCVEMFLFHHFRFFFVFVSCCLFLTLYAHSAHNTQTISHYDSNSSMYISINDFHTSRLTQVLLKRIGVTVYRQA